MPKEIGGIKTFTVKETSDLFGLSPQSLRKYLKEGRIKAQKVGVKWLISEEAIRAFLNGDNGAKL